ncbi:MAG: hypothetical protein DWQ36_24880 [Acidobacteria bacterium]|nr:MAG: hypothetical protein DWQ36_24880 [Acidobacteriota bacterium]
MSLLPRIGEDQEDTHDLSQHPPRGAEDAAPHAAAAGDPAACPPRGRRRSADVGAGDPRRVARRVGRPGAAAERRRPASRTVRSHRGLKRDPFDTARLRGRASRRRLAPGHGAVVSTPNRQIAEAATAPIRCGDFVGEVVRDHATPEVAERLLRLVDPSAALETLHWGRNYLYSARLGEGATAATVVVKQFRNDTFKARLRRRQRGSKAQLSFRHALRLGEIGVGTPEPIAYLDSSDLAGPCFYVCRLATDRLEARYLVRALEAGTADVDYPQIDAEAVFREIGRVAARLHDGRFWHRDLTAGNVLIDPRAFRPGGTETSEPSPPLLLLDLNRARVGRQLSRLQRVRDLSRMPAPRRDQRQALLDGYERTTGERLGPWRGVYEVLRRGFLLKNRSKRGVRGLGRRIGDLLLPRRRPHAHIPPAAARASSRDKIVWDALSDQPHQHATRSEKLIVRLRDLPEHALALGGVALHLAAVRRRMKELEESLYAEPSEFRGVGVGLRPGGDPKRLRDAVRALGVGEVLLRLHPWQSENGAELELAELLAADGVTLTFALPQNRDLVRDPDLWTRRVRELARRFAPLGRAFQVGQAPNRSKWGIWRPSEYVELYRRAATELRAARPDVLLLGPAVIDFELYATAALANLRREGLEFDALASLLYVDRRGAPENRQLGLDLEGKLRMLRAIAETSRNCPSGRSWITEFNWPLWQGPHSPAGRDVAVDEATQAGYLVRYFVQALSTGLVEKVFWWQLVSKGYGLIDPVGDELARRPSFRALQQMQAELSGARSLGPVGTVNERQRLFRFVWPDGRQTLVGWTLDGRDSHVAVPGHVLGAVDRDGAELPSQAHLQLGPQPRYLRLAPEARPLAIERDDPTQTRTGPAAAGIGPA